VTPHLPDQDLLEAEVLDAALVAGVERIVKISGGAASLGQNGPSPTAVAHWRSERRIEDSGLEFSFLRPSYYMQNLLDLGIKRGLLLAPMGHAPIAMIDVGDVGACAAAELLTDESINRAWQLTGPSGVTFDDVAKVLGARYLNVPLRLARIGLERRGAQPGEVEHALRMAAYFASGADGAPTDSVRRLTGRPPRSLAEFVSHTKGT
jgi:NAD(P)H dehydrogenase (quinone)